VTAWDQRYSRNASGTVDEDGALVELCFEEVVELREPLGDVLALDVEEGVDDVVEGARVVDVLHPHCSCHN
jgi:hypothetical protein